MTDTITIFIPLGNQLPQDSTKISKNRPVTAVKNMADSSNDKSNLAGKKTKNPSSAADCKVMASDYDMDVLRVNILIENTEENKIIAAKKFFNSKCILVSQAKALSELFASDKNKYQFFEAAYPFISDRSNFGQLVSLLSDPNYINQFRAIGQ